MKLTETTGRYLIIILAFLSMFFRPDLPRAAELAILQGRIIDMLENPVQNAEVLVYNSPNIKRPADFISSRTGPDGHFQMTLLPGRYWVLAVLRKGGNRFGPLGLEDKHSGAPLVLDLEELDERRLDFVVFDLREAAIRQDKKNADLVMVSGRIIDKQGNPVSMAYVAADKNRENREIPAYISSWTDDLGQYSIYLPRGSFFLGAARVFPPAGNSLPAREIFFENNVSDLDIVLGD